MKENRWVLWFVVSFALVLPAMAQNDAARARAAAGCGPSGDMFDVQTTDQKHPVGQIEKDKALVYFFADSEAAPTMRVGVDGKWMGANDGKSYFFFQVDPGTHNLCTEWQSGTFKKMSERAGEAMRLVTEAGKTYFVRMTYAHGIRLELADEAEGQFLIGSSRFATSKPKMH